MEENTTSWKSHGFTLMVFGGIVVLSSIFFVLGMLVGRSQGQHAAEVALADSPSRKSVAENGTEDFPLTFYNQSTEEKPDLRLKPIPEAPEKPETPPPPPPAASKNTPPPAASDSRNDKKSAAPPPSPPAKPAAPKSSTADVYLQVSSAKTEKQGAAELKKVQSKGFKATMRPFKLNGTTVYRILVGPVKESEWKSVRSELIAKGYKDPIKR